MIGRKETVRFGQSHDEADVRAHNQAAAFDPKVGSSLPSQWDAPLQELDEARAEAAYAEADVVVAKARFAEA